MAVGVAGQSFLKDEPTYLLLFLRGRENILRFAILVYDFDG